MNALKPVGRKSSHAKRANIRKEDGDAEDDDTKNQTPNTRKRHREAVGGKPSKKGRKEEAVGDGDDNDDDTRKRHSNKKLEDTNQEEEDKVDVIFAFREYYRKNPVRPFEWVISV